MKVSGIGVATLIAMPMASIIAICTIIGIPISIITLLIYGILIYLSIIPTAYFLGSYLIKTKVENDYLLLGISLLGIMLIEKIPIIGGIVSFISLCMGLGFYTIWMIKVVKSEKVRAKKAS